MNNKTNNHKYFFCLAVLLLAFFYLSQPVVFSKRVKRFKSHESKLIKNSSTLYETKCTLVAKEGMGKISSCCSNDPIFTDIIPNPIVYWYGTSTNEEPILLLNFKAGIPVKCLTSTLITDLDSFHLKLEIPSQYGYYYKILKIFGESKAQTITYSHERTTSGKIEPSYQRAKAGSVEVRSKRDMQYEAERPIIAFYGVSSDTLTIMLRRGKKYPIPNCQIEVSMLVRAIKQNVNDCRTANDFYKITNTPCCDLKFNKSIIQVIERPFTKYLPFIAKIFVVPIAKLFCSTRYDVKVIKPAKSLFTTSRILRGSHVTNGFCTQNNIIDFCNGSFRDDDLLYKEMELPYKIKEDKKEKNSHCNFILKCN